MILRGYSAMQKCKNILLTSNGLIKLGDFGFSHQYEDTVSGVVANTFCGTPYYLPVRSENPDGDFALTMVPKPIMAVVAFSWRNRARPRVADRGTPVVVGLRLARLGLAEILNTVRGPSARAHESR